MSPSTRPTLRLSGEAAQKARQRLALTAPKGTVTPPPKSEKPKPPQSDPKKARREAMRARREKICALHSQLAEAFPATFAPLYCGTLGPLKIGIHLDLAERLPEVSKQAIRAFLASYTRAPDYRSLLVAGATRLDLDGQPAGRVSEAEARSAQEASRRSALAHPHGVAI
ncbi:ProQ/FINO family protein [Rhizobiales bacterium GAS191]|nr:ProQ/FINO family protein [Rhizobiales bacterium GAS191]